ncbi:hypothetical protein D3C71_1393900 [compost metagenome]
MLLQQILVLIHDRLQRVGAGQKVGEACRGEQDIQIGHRTVRIHKTHPGLNQFLAGFDPFLRSVQLGRRRLQRFLGIVDLGGDLAHFTLHQLDLAEHNLQILCGLVLVMLGLLALGGCFFLLGLGVLGTLLQRLQLLVDFGDARFAGISFRGLEHNGGQQQ